MAPRRLQLLHVHHLRIDAHRDERRPGITNGMNHVAGDVGETSQSLSNHCGALGFGREINTNDDRTPGHCRLLARVQLQGGPILVKES
jgi:hypothetical protein